MYLVGFPLLIIPFAIYGIIAFLFNLGFGDTVFTLPMMSVLGLACAGCYLFAFFPAAWYVHRFAAAPTAR